MDRRLDWVKSGRPLLDRRLDWVKSGRSLLDRRLGFGLNRRLDGLGSF